MNKVKKISDSKVKTIGDIAAYVKKYDLGKSYRSIPFSKLTTLRMGGIIELLYFPNNIDSFIKVMKIIKKNNIKYFLIGNGSNVFANDKHYDGVVINLKEIDFTYELKDEYVKVSAGMSMAKLIFNLMKYDIGGLEFLVGIPGSIGGIIYMNAGAYGHNISEYILELKVLDKENNVRVLKRKNLNFSYRSSTIKEEGMIVLEAKLKVEGKKKELIKQEIKLYLQNRKENQPLDHFNAGCTFKNGEISSWKLIDEIGYRGYRVGDAGVSEKHSNFLINYGNASSLDMLHLIEILKYKVKEEKKIDLECEWIFVNFDLEENVV